MLGRKSSALASRYVSQYRFVNFQFQFVLNFLNDLISSLQVSERLNLASSGGKDLEDDEYECQVCNANLFVSLVTMMTIMMTMVTTMMWTMMITMMMTMMINGE